MKPINTKHNEIVCALTNKAGNKYFLAKAYFFKIPPVLVANEL